MIKEFSVKNFMSFKEEVIFSMEALTESVSEYPSNVSNVCDNEILKVSSIYGPNASGKTNLLKVIMFLKNFLTTEGLAIEDIKKGKIRTKSLKSLEQFKFGDDKDYISTFKLFIVNENFEFAYELHLRREPDDLVKAIYENFSYRLLDEVEFVNVFERIGEQNNVSGYKPRYEDDKFLVSYQSSLLSSLGKSDYFEEIQPKHFFIVNEFMKEVKNIYVMEANRNLRDDLLFLEKVYKREEEKKEIIGKLNELGVNVKDIIVDDSSDDPKFYFVRIINGKEYKLDLFDESEGVLSLVYLIPLINVFLAVGSTFIIDELDAHLHPKILQEIIKRFQSKSNTYSQLIFTSHDITNMDNDIFRRFKFRNRGIR